MMLNCFDLKLDYNNKSKHGDVFIPNKTLEKN